MAWIESHQSLEKHPKVFDLMRAMGWDLDTTIGKLHRLWWWCVDYAEDGDLRRHPDNRIAAAVGVNGEVAPKFVSALLKHGWIDRKPYRRIHDWWRYIGPYLQSRYKRSPEKWERVRTMYVTGTSPVRERLRNSRPLPLPLPLPTKDKDIKDGALRLFMQHFTQTLRTKTGQEADPKLVRKAYGKVVGYLKTYPEEQAALSDELDRTPEKMPAAWYVAFLCGQIEQRTHEKLKAMTAGVAK